MRNLIILLSLLISISASAQVYKWVDEKGVVHYTDQPPTQNAKPAKLPPLQTYKGGAVPNNLDKFAKPVAGSKAAASGAATIKILSPGPDETYRSDSESSVPVSVLVSPSLAEGEMLAYYLNGAVQGAPTRSASFTINNVERGSHNISVGLVSAGGQEIARSATVTVHMKQNVIQKAPPPPPKKP